MEITDEVYSNLNDSELQKRINKLSKQDKLTEENELQLFIEFLNWKKRQSAK